MPDETTSPAASPTNANNPQPGSSEDTGTPADRESMATDPNKPLEYRPGQPLAREGLEIKTVRPRWTTTTQLTHGVPATNPQIRIRFGRDGKVLRASFVAGTQTRSAAIDEPILNAVYEWTAKGREVDAIPAEPRFAGVDVTITFIF